MYYHYKHYTLLHLVHKIQHLHIKKTLHFTKHSTLYITQHSMCSLSTKQVLIKHGLPSKHMPSTLHCLLLVQVNIAMEKSPACLTNLYQLETLLFPYR